MYEPYAIMSNINGISNFDDKFTPEEIEVSLSDGLEYTRHPDIVYFDSTEDDHERGESRSSRSLHNGHSLVSDAIDVIREAQHIHSG